MPMKEYPNREATRGKVRRAALLPFIFLLPALAILLSLTIFPLAYSLRLSFMSWELLRPGARMFFIGLENYIEILSEPRFLSSLLYTCQIVYTAIPCEILIGIGIALLLNRDIRGRPIFQLLILMPMIVAPVITGSITRLLFEEVFGPVNYFFLASGITDVRLQWLSKPSLAQAVIIFMQVWRWTPFAILLIFAGLSTVPRPVYEAARLDGASSFKLFRHVTLPFLRKHIAIIVFIRLIWLFTLYDIVYVVTHGGPGRSTETVSYYTYLTGFTFFSMGKAAAMSYIILILVIAVIVNFVKIGITRST